MSVEVTKKFWRREIIEESTHEVWIRWIRLGFLLAPLLFPILSPASTSSARVVACCAGILTLLWSVPVKKVKANVTRWILFGLYVALAVVVLWMVFLTQTLTQNPGRETAGVVALFAVTYLVLPLLDIISNIFDTASAKEKPLT